MTCWQNVHSPVGFSPISFCLKRLFYFIFQALSEALQEPLSQCWRRKNLSKSWPIFYQKLFSLKNVIFVERTVIESRFLFGHRSRQPPRRIENRTYFSSARGTRNEDQVRARAVVRLHRRVQRWREAKAGVRACRNWLCSAGVLLI